MEQALATLDGLAKSKNLMSAEHLLMSACRALDPFLVAPMTDDCASKLFTGLLGLFLANRGEYSLPCAIYIATKIATLFEISSVPKLWDLINIAEVRNSPALAIATGYICRRVGRRFKSQLPHFIDLLMKQDPQMEFAGLHAMNCAFKTGGSYVTQMAVPSLEFARKIIQTTANPAAVWAGLKLARTLLKASIPPSQVLEVATVAMRHKDQPWLLNEIARAVARAVFFPYSKLNLGKMIKTGEWALGGMRNQRKTLNFTPAFQAIETFKPIFANVWTNFLNLIGPELIAMNHAELFEFVRKTSPESVRLLIPMLPADLRFSYFRDVAAEKMSAEQLKTLMILCPDDGCIGEAAGVALLQASSDDKQARDVAISFFSGLSRTHSSLVLPYLRSCLVYILQPPERNARILIELRGSAAVLCTVLENVPDVEAAVVPNFETFATLVTDVCRKPKATSYRFIFTFGVLAVLPERFSRIEGVRKAVDFALNYLGSNDPNKPPKMQKRLLKNVLKFRARYPEPHQNHQLMQIAVNTKTKLPFSVINCLCHIIPKTIPDDPIVFPATKLILSFALQVRPSQRFLKSWLERPLPMGTDLISCQKTITQQQQKWITS
jgi:hypothetical protein